MFDRGWFPFCFVAFVIVASLSGAASLRWYVLSIVHHTMAAAFAVKYCVELGKKLLAESKVGIAHSYAHFFVFVCVFGMGVFRGAGDGY